MSYRLDVKKLINDLRGPKGIAALTEELAKVSSEVEQFKDKMKPQAEAKVKAARAKVDEIQKLLKKAHVELDSEFKKTLSILKKYGEQAEKQIQGLGSTFSAKPKLKGESLKKEAPKAGQSTKRKTRKRTAPSTTPEKV